MRRILLGFLLGAFLCFSAYAQEEARDIYDLESAVTTALENSLSLQRSQLNLQNTEANLLQNQGQRWPNLSTGASSGYRWGRSINPVTNLFENNRIGNVNLFANAGFTLFGAGRINNSIKQSKKDLESNISTVVATTNDITLNIINLFINVVFNREQLKIAKNQLVTTEEQLVRTKKLVDAGQLAVSEQLNIQSQNATNRLEVVNAENALRISKLNLAQAMQIPFTEAFDVIEPEFEINESLMATETASDIYEVAVDIMPEIAAADAAVQSAEYGVRVAKGAFYPTIQVSAGMFSNYVDQVFGTERPNFGTQIENNLSQSLDVRLNIPIFSNLNNKASLQRARVQQQLSEISAIEARNQLRQDIESAYNSALAAEQSYEASLIRVESLEESFRIAQQQFDLGAINSVDFQVEQNNYFNAQADLLNAKYTYIFRVKVLDFYLGNPINLN